jgi:hypothetical protein
MLPFFSILCAFTIRELKEVLGPNPVRFSLLMTSAVTFVIYLLLIHVIPSRIEDQNFPLLVFPLVLACLLLCFLAAVALLHQPAVLAIRKIVFILFASAFAWASLVSFLYDYPRHTKWRALWYKTGEAVHQAVPPRSVFFANESDPYMRLIDDDVIMAFPPLDRFADFSSLLRFHLEAGRRTFGAFPKEVWKLLTVNGPLRTGEYKVSPVLDLGRSILAEISLPDRAEQGGGVSPLAVSGNVRPSFQSDTQSSRGSTQQ